MSDYEIRRFEDRYPIYELCEKNTRSRMTIAPDRGGIVTGLELNGRELLYMDKETFYDPNANIRGGIPVLFPISGSLDEGRYEWGGRTYAMKSHGLARLLPWEVAETKADDQAASITVRLASTPATLEQYPFDFELSFTYILQNAALRIEQRYVNRSDSPMPMYPGFHPYFLTETKHLRLDTDATGIWDMNDNMEKPFAGSVDLSESKQAVLLLGASRNDISFGTSATTRVRMSYGPEFRCMVLWNIPERPFVCVEPWMAQPREMHRKRELTMVEPGGTLTTQLTISE